MKQHILITLASVLFASAAEAGMSMMSDYDAKNPVALQQILEYGKTPEELEHFTWNDDYTINLQCKKRSVRPLHPQWVFLFQLKEKQPSKLKSCWNKILKGLSKEQDAGLVLPIEDVLLAHKVRKLYYTPSKRQLQVGSQKKRLRLLCSV